LINLSREVLKVHQKTIQVILSQKKVNNNNNNDRDWKKVHINPKVKVINKNTIVVRGYDGTQKQIIVVSDKNTCPTQLEKYR
jgi:hypothetical protein